MPLNGAKRGKIPSHVGQNGACFCMSKERSDSMETTLSPFSTADKDNIIHLTQKANGFSLFYSFSNGNSMPFLYLHGFISKADTHWYDSLMRLCHSVGPRFLLPDCLLTLVLISAGSYAWHTSARRRTAVRTASTAAGGESGSASPA